MLVGIFIAAGLAALFVLAMKVSNLSTLATGETYTVIARFDNIGGLKVRSPVTVGGVRVGRVGGIEYDTERFEAVVTLELEGRYDQFPADTSAGIYTAGLLGEQYVALEPGGAEELLSEGSQIELTQSAMIIEKLVGKFLFEKAGESD